VLCFYCEPHLLQDQALILLAIARYASSEKHLILSHQRLSLRSLMQEMGSAGWYMGNYDQNRNITQRHKKSPGRNAGAQTKNPFP